MRRTALAERNICPADKRGRTRIAPLPAAGEDLPSGDGQPHLACGSAAQCATAVRERGNLSEGRRNGDFRPAPALPACIVSASCNRCRERGCRAVTDRDARRGDKIDRREVATLDSKLSLILEAPMSCC